MMDAALVINGVVDTIARDIAKLSDMNPVQGGKWVSATSGSIFAGYLYDGSKFTAPTLPPAPSALVITYKADVWRRATPDQAAVIDTELTKLDVRMRRLWDDALYIDHSSQEFALLQQTMVTAFGQSEADRILAPSNG